MDMLGVFQANQTSKWLNPHLHKGCLYAIVFKYNLGEGSNLRLLEFVTQPHCLKYFGNQIYLN